MQLTFTEAIHTRDKVINTCAFGRTRDGEFCVKKLKQHQRNQEDGGRWENF